MKPLKQRSFYAKLLCNNFQIQTYKSEDISYVVGEEGSLGEGSFGVVQVGFHKVHGTIAIKCIPFSGRYAEKQKFLKKYVVGFLRKLLHRVCVQCETKKKFLLHCSLSN